MTELCTFRIGAYDCALDVARVREIIRPRRPTPVPRGGEGVAGLIALRGRILTAFDLGPRLGLDARDPGYTPYGIVLDDERARVCLLVDDVGQVREIDPKRLGAPPADLDPRLEGVVEASYRGPRGLILVLSPEGIKP